MAKKKVVKLQLDNDYDFVLLGLVSTAKDYRVCHLLNKMFELDLCKGDDISITINKKGNSNQFSYYDFVNEDHEEFYFISNKGKTTSFIPEYKLLDYFLLVKNQVSPNCENEILEKLKGNSLILGVYPINVFELKSRDNLMF
ncbi:MAG: IPExxxVDY family protein [Bacteroidia bacterium]|nr:IPExxxVDY family protein [Bacteroidia bacterium]